MAEDGGGVVVIGAGMAGLACARRLADAGLRPLVLDKGRGIGGRLATRRATLPVGAVTFDHGAQYLTVRDPGFVGVIDALAAQGVAAQWKGGDRPRWVGTPGMSALPRALAHGLEVRQGVEVRAIRRGDTGWTVHTDTEVVSARAVVATVPAPQVAALVGTDHALVPGLAEVRLAPCLTLMAAFAADTPRAFDAEARDDDPLAWIACDATKPGRPAAAQTWVAQAAPDWSARYLEDDRPAIADRMLPLLAARLGLSAGDVLHAAAHRWRYARVTAPLGQPFLHDRGLWLGGDWCLGARVEAAWISGTAIANDLLERADVA